MIYNIVYIHIYIESKGEGERVLPLTLFFLAQPGVPARVAATRYDTNTTMK